MSNKPKNSLLGERPEYVIEGDILADGFRDRKTGKPINEASTPEEIEWVKKASEKIHIENGDVVVDNALVVKEGETKLPIYIDEDSEGNERVAVNGLVSNGDAEFKGDLTAKTLKQTQANYLFNFSFEPTDTTNFELVGERFARIEVVNGELHIIGMARYHNKDSATHVFTLGQFTISDIPTEIGEKIYGHTGKNITEANAGHIRVCPMGVGGGIQALRITSVSANSLQFYHGQNISVTADDTITMSFEANLSLF